MFQPAKLYEPPRKYDIWSRHLLISQIALRYILYCMFNMHVWSHGIKSHANPSSKDNWYPNSPKLEPQTIIACAVRRLILSDNAPLYILHMRVEAGIIPPLHRIFIVTGVNWAPISRTFYFLQFVLQNHAKITPSIYHATTELRR